ncbi:1-acylglycerol-3-phosphate o-acyltransferase [Mycena indigotica]|uniref:1-acyl-sn-glycerol-3-phosphate acyltransferase n=1 Tax=Mycena indigotica TaxID=2126181 RepID=A0A8H6W0L2_9AGAR|nr:1-acylglycerol-3-phosphate o-acyltransferase [Mycena indigotica]KAF7301094.1 1-acylglycerol-3-phosphate o-acyltransferase [Mycena indigotica]
MAMLLSLLAYASVPLIALQYIPSGRNLTRRVAYVVSMSLCGLMGLPYLVVMLPVGQRYSVHWAVARTFYYVAGAIFGLRVEIEGEEYLRDTNDGGALPAILMANHQSMLDILPVGGTMPKRASIMSKKSLQYTPLGPFMLLSGAVFVDRGNSASALRSLDLAVQKMRENRLSLWLFPEGTRHSTEAPTLLPFKKGGFHLAIQSGLPIIPVVFENYWHLYHKGVFDSGVIRVKVLPPIKTTGLTVADIPDLCTRVREQMLTTLIDISRKVPSPSQEAKDSTSSTLITGQPDDAAVDAANAPKDATPTVPVVPSHESLASLVSGSNTTASTGGGETEDEDMVVVKRPN